MTWYITEKWAALFTAMMWLGLSMFTAYSEHKMFVRKMESELKKLSFWDDDKPKGTLT